MDTEPSWHALTISGQPGKGTAHQRKKDVVLARKKKKNTKKKKKKTWQKETRHYLCGPIICENS